MSATKTEKKIINTNLFSLKIITFLIITGLAAIHVLHSFQPLILGLYFDEFRLISIIIPIISLIGPLIVGPLADRLAAKNSNGFGWSLRVLTAVCLVLAAIFYGCLLAVPAVNRQEARRPLVSFSCDLSGAEIFQERCTEFGESCHQRSQRVGTLVLKNCSYTCQDPKQFESLYTPWVKGSPAPAPATNSVEFNDSDTSADYDYKDTTTTTETTRPKRSADNFYTEDSMEVITDDFGERDKRQVNEIYVEPPHLCTKRKENGIEVVDKCHVYTADTSEVKVYATLRGSTDQRDNETQNKDWCRYALDGFQCNVPEAQAKWMRIYRGSNCTPAVECEVFNPYDSLESVLADSVCIKTVGDINVTLWAYSVLRTLGEIFALAALTLLNTAIIIAVRDTSEGRGEVCRQYVWGAIGFIIVLPLAQYGLRTNVANTVIYAAVLVTVVCFILAALVLLFAGAMPLSPPEWWWHTKTGMLVFPMSAIRRYSPEMAMLTVIAIIYGTFWSSIHTYLNWTYEDTYCATLFGLVFILLLFFNADKFIEYAGHSNILISGFALFIIRFTALAEKIRWLTILMETIEPLEIGLIWVTIILYMRHIIPRKFTATGQAVAVIAFFCIGKSFGALVGLIKHYKLPEYDNCMYHGLAVAACILSVVYFVIYNLLLAPRCAAKPQPAPQVDLSQPPLNGANTTTNGSNGNYTPLRVYHNERGKKNQFRY